MELLRGVSAAKCWLSFHFYLRSFLIVDHDPTAASATPPECRKRRAGRGGRRSAAHRAGQDRRLLCGPTRQPCARPFGQGQFHLAVLIFALSPKADSPILELLPPPRTPPSRPRASVRGRASACGPRDNRR